MLMKSGKKSKKKHGPDKIGGRYVAKEKINPRHTHVYLLVNRFTHFFLSLSLFSKHVRINTRLTFDHCQNVIEPQKKRETQF